MALTFPLAVAQFWQTLSIESATLDDPENAEMSMTGGGDVLIRRLGPALWRGSVSTYDHLHDCGRKKRAIFDLARRSGSSFLVTPWQYSGPLNREGAAYPAVKLAAVSSNNRDVTFSGTTFPLAPGDFVSWTYGSDPVRYAMHQIIRTVGAAYEVTPLVRPGWTADTPVALNAPVFKAVMLPGTGEYGASRRVAAGNLSFDYIQTLR